MENWFISWKSRSTYGISWHILSFRMSLLRNLYKSHRNHTNKRNSSIYWFIKRLPYSHKKSSKLRMLIMIKSIFLRNVNKSIEYWRRNLFSFYPRSISLMSFCICSIDFCLQNSQKNRHCKTYCETIGS